MVKTVLFGIGVGVGIVAVAEVSGVVVVQQVIVARLAARIDRPRQRLQIVHDRANAGLRGVRAVGVGAAAVRRRAETNRRRSRPPCTSCWYAVAGFGFSTSSTTPALAVPVATSDLCGGVAGISLAIAEPDRVAVAEHDVVRARSAVHRLVEVVAHRILVGQLLEVRHVAVLHVVKAQRGRALAGGYSVGRILSAEVRRLRETVRARAHRHFHPGKQCASQPEGLLAEALAAIAIQLLPHLVEAVHRARRIGVIGEGIAVGQLERARRKGVHIRDARVGSLRCLARAAGHEVARSSRREGRFQTAWPDVRLSSVT